MILVTLTKNPYFNVGGPTIVIGTIQLLFREGRCDVVGKNTIVDLIKKSIYNLREFFTVH